MPRRRWLAAAALSIVAGCGGLQLRLHNSSVQRPSNVALYFAVETSDGAPIGGLSAESFRIYEDGELISPFESKQTILNPEIAVVHYVLLLLDLSGSITESGSTEALIGAASTFAERVTRQQQMAIYGFDGSAGLMPITSFTARSKAVSAGLQRLTQYKPRDPSTNLNGALVEAVKLVEQQMSRATQPLRFGTVVVFTDGTDRAHRVPTAQMHEVLQEAQVNVFAIGLGPEISPGELKAIGRDGFVQVAQQAQISSAFEEVAQQIEAASRKFYLLSYCSPSRAGRHELRVEVTVEGRRGALEHAFDAAGFGPACDPRRPPSFSVERILLSERH